MIAMMAQPLAKSIQCLCLCLCLFLCLGYDGATSWQERRLLQTVSSGFQGGLHLLLLSTLPPWPDDDHDDDWADGHDESGDSDRHN